MDYETIGKLYAIWHGMRNRCYRPNVKNYRRYGARGIYIAEAWRDDFNSFCAWCQDHEYRQGQEIDRIDNDGPYSPENCRVVSRRVNVNNRDVTRSLTLLGETKPLQYWAEDQRCPVSADIIWSRLKRGWSEEWSVLAPKGSPTDRPKGRRLGRPKQTHCGRGHLFESDSFYEYKEGTVRQCKQCTSDRGALNYAKAREEAGQYK